MPQLSTDLTCLGTLLHWLRLVSRNPTLRSSARTPRVRVNQTVSKQANLIDLVGSRLGRRDEL